MPSVKSVGIDCHDVPHHLFNVCGKGMFSMDKHVCERMIARLSIRHSSPLRHLLEHRVQDAAVAVVVHFDGRVDAAGADEGDGAIGCRLSAVC